MRNVFRMSGVAFVAVALATSCGRKSNSFRGTVGAYVPDGSGAVGEGSCASGIRATRTLFVVDNSGSHGTENGTDPVKSGVSVRSQTENYTIRQNAIYKAITTIWDKEKARFDSDSTYVGSKLALAYFPKSSSDLTYNTVAIDGTTAQPTNFPGANYNDAFKQKIWDSLAFTHTPDSMTPYQAVLDAALVLLPPDSADKRSKELVLVSDGLPTDKDPAALAAAAAQLAAQNIRLTILYIFKPSRDEHVPSVFGPRTPTLQRIESTDAYKSLQTMYDSGSWADTTKYPSFTGYWSSLSKIPQAKNNGGISDYYIPLSTEKLEQEIVNIIGKIAYCSG